MKMSRFDTSASRATMNDSRDRPFMPAAFCSLSDARFFPMQPARRSCAAVEQRIDMASANVRHVSV